MASSASTPQCVAEEAISGLWAVDRRTGRPVKIRGHMQLGMQMQEARDLASKLCRFGSGPRSNVE